MSESMLCHRALNIQHTHAWLTELAIYTHVFRSQCIVLLNEITQAKQALALQISTHYLFTIPSHC